MSFLWAMGSGRLHRRRVSIWVDAEFRPKEKLVVLGLAFDDCPVLVDGDLLGLTEVGNLYVFQLDVEACGDRLATGEEGNVLQHTLALIPEAGCPDSSNSQRATQLVYDESSQRLASNILCDYEQWLATLCDLLK